MTCSEGGSKRQQAAFAGWSSGLDGGAVSEHHSAGWRFGRLAACAVVTTQLCRAVQPQSAWRSGHLSRAHVHDADLATGLVAEADTQGQSQRLGGGVVWRCQREGERVSNLILRGKNKDFMGDSGFNEKLQPVLQQTRLLLLLMMGAHLVPRQQGN